MVFNATPPESAFAAYMAGSNGNRPVAVVEGGYLDQRTPDDPDRAAMHRDSLYLIGLLQAVPRPPVVLRTFLVNDFTKMSYCGSNRCSTDRSPPSDGGNGDAACSLPIWSYESPVSCGNLQSPPLREYGMRNARNRAVEYISRLLRRPDGGHLRVENDGDMIDIYADTDDGDVYLGCRKTGSHGISVRCTALMAQHYFDLYLHAKTSCPDMTDLWVFDFNRAVEAERVRLGAIASYALYDWPNCLRANVVNCVYFPDRTDLPSVRITSRP